MKHVLATLLLAITAALTLPAADPPKFDAAAAAKLLAPFLDEQTFATVRIDVASIDVDAAAEKLAKYTGQPDEEVRKVRRIARDFQARFTRAGGHEFYAVVSIADLPRPGPFVLAPAAGRADAAALKEALADLSMETTDVIGGVAFAGSKRTLERLRGVAPTARPDLAAALAGAGSAQALAVFSLSDDQRRVVAELFPKLPDALGGRPTTGWIHGTRWAALAADFTPKMTVKLTVQGRDEATVKDLNALVGAGLLAARVSPNIRRDVPFLDQLAATLRPQVEGDQLRIVFDETAAGVAQLSMSLIQSAQRNARLQQSVNNLKQLALAMHNYHDAYRALPGHATYSKDGKTPLLSWRVAILPFVEQDGLYKQFKLDEPWDSEHNKKLIPLMPKVYLDTNAPAAKEPGTTHYQIFVGGGSAWERGPKQPLFPKSFPDGTSNTILIAEGGEPVVWTKPDDLAYDPTKPLPKLGADATTGFIVAMADGSARVIRPAVSEKTIRAAITAAGGETLGPDWR
jgi:hypothetical protein